MKMTKANAKNDAPQQVTLGFGVPASIDPHHFKVIIPKSNSGKVEITEYLGLQAQSEEHAVIERVVLERPYWTAIRAEIQRAFNARLKSNELRTSSWKVGENKVDRLLGKELCVLAWAIEGMEIENIPVALRNWLALRPEDRWWLFGMTAMSTGEKDDRDVGWRIALRHALGDIVQSEQFEVHKRAVTVETVVPIATAKVETPQTTLPFDDLDDHKSNTDIASTLTIVQSGIQPTSLSKTAVIQQVSSEPTEPEALDERIDDSVFMFESKSAKAVGHPVHEGKKLKFLVKKGSTANISLANSLRPAIKALRKKLIDDGILKPDGNVWLFSAEFIFDSASAAATVVSGNPRSGMDAWKDLQGRSLKQLGYGK